MEDMKGKAIRRAIKVAEEVFKDFMNDIVNKKVVAVRAHTSKTRALNDKEWKAIESGKRIDNRPIHLLSISGKGGSAYPEYENVTLLDHLLSVARGAMLLAVMDDVTELDEEDIPVLKRQLALVVATAFLHDLDKDWELKRDAELTPEMAEDRLNQYGIEEWLSKYQVSLTPRQVLHLIELVEDKQQFRHMPDVPLPKEATWAEIYVGVADKLDGAWLHKDEGRKAVLERLQKKDSRIKNPLTKEWRMPAIDIFDPHHPFLLDELQRCISWECSLQLSIPPLIEIHKDGRLFMLLPERGKETDVVIEKGFERFAGRLPGGLRLEIEAGGSKGVPKLVDGRPDYDEFLDFLRERDDADCVKIFYVKKETEEIVEDKIGDILDDTGLPLKWSGENLCLPFSDLEGVDPEAKERFMAAAVAALLLNLPDKPDTRKKREEEFNSVLKQALPEWLNKIKDAQSRHTLTALWAAVYYEENDPEFSTIWGEEGKENGLLRQWWEGDKKRKGLRKGIEDKGGERIQAVLKHYQAILSGKRVVSDNEGAEGRCIFTDCPVPIKEVIRKNTHKLDSLKSSAFTGRDGHEEDLSLTEGRTHVEPVSIVEYQIRREARKISGIKHKGMGDPPMPTLISSPTTSGLFGGFAIDNRQNFQDLSIYKLATTDISKDAVSFDLNHYMNRARIARFENLADNMKKQIPQLRLLLNAALRMGRPIHIFRGLPVPQLAFFYFDAMSKYLAELIGGKGLCLDQIPKALERIKIAEILLNTDGLGLDMLRSFVSEKGRFGALCLAWCRLLDAEKHPGTRNFLREECILKDMKEGKMTEQDGIFIRFAEKASTIQRSFWERASHNEQLMVFNLAFQAVINASRGRQSDRKSLVQGVAGDIEKNLRRKNLYAIDKWQSDKLAGACVDVAEFFVDEVWFTTLNGRILPQSVKGTLESIYRMALLEIYRSRRESESNEK